MIPLAVGLMLHKVKVLFPNSHSCSSLSLCFSGLYLHWYSANMKWCLCASAPQGFWGWQLIFWQDKQKQISLYISVRTCKNHKKKKFCSSLYSSYTSTLQCTKQYIQPLSTYNQSMNSHLQLLINSVLMKQQCWSGECQWFTKHHRAICRDNP